MNTCDIEPNGIPFGYGNISFNMKGNESLVLENVTVTRQDGWFWP